MINRFKSKLIANGLLAGIALAVLAILLTAIWGDQLYEDLVKERRDNHRTLAGHQARKVLKEQARTGEDDALVALLETSRWRDIQFGDRIYPLKRKLLAHLCMNLKQRADYHALAHWSAQWMSLNERNLDARAFWYEAIRHVPGREREGLEGLFKNQHNFPDNVLLATFLVEAYRETDNTAAAESLIHSIARDLADDVAENWELFWITQGQERFSQAQSRRFTVSTNGDGKCYLVVKLPAEATMLRVDPPPRSALRIYDIELVVNHKKKLVQISDLSHEQITQDNGSLIVQQSEDPKFIIPIEVREDELGGNAIRIKLEFRVNLIVHGTEVPLVEFL